MADHPQAAASGRRTMGRRDYGMAAWVAFLAASAGTFVLFGVIDPSEIESAWMQRWEVSRKLAYSIGFLFLFVICFLSSALSVFMLRTGSHGRGASGQGGRGTPEIRDPSADNPDLDLEDLR